MPRPHLARRAPRAGLSVRALALLGASALALAAPDAGRAEGPEGGVVARGEARIVQQGGRTVVRQRSQRAVIDWKSFDVGRGEEVRFAQPGRGSATLNRIEAASPSVIEGAIRAPGTVVIQNGAGVIFSRGARIDVGGLVATSQSVDAGRFQRSGALSIGGGERPGARVVNRGEITIGEAGLAALVGGDVENAGAIIARGGAVALASGRRTTIDLAGDGMVRIAVDGVGAGAANSGLIDVGGGRVLVTAEGAAGALDRVINTSGVIRATSGSGAGGRIDLIGRGGGAVEISGRVDASGATRGGAVTATGATLRAAPDARIAANGGAEGGSIRLGGDRGGAGPLRRADHLNIDAGARVSASGGTGAGGTIIAWADDSTRVDGAVAATGAGGGGFVETSGALRLAIGPEAEVSLGRGGRWLLDPRDVEITNAGLASVPPGETAPPPGSGPFLIRATAIAATLNGGADVTITTEQPSGGDRGDILVSSPLTWNGDGALTLDADRDLTIRKRIQTRDGDFIGRAADDIEVEDVIRSIGAADIRLETTGLDPVNAPEIRVDRDIEATGAGDVRLIARRGGVLLRGDAAQNLRVRTGTGALEIDAQGGSVRLARVSDASGSNIQVWSESGAVDIRARDAITLSGGDARSGQWVRIGRSDSEARVSLSAPRIALEGGAARNTFAEVVAGRGGSIEMRAGHIAVTNGASEARIQGFAGASLDLAAETQAWDGPVRAGNGPETGGDVRLAGAVTASVAPEFSLAADRAFTFAPRAPGGAPSAYVSPLGLLVETFGLGEIEVDAPIRAGRVELRSQAAVGLGPNARVTGEGPGDAVVIAAGAAFRNRAGASPIATPDEGARWLVYIDSFAGLEGPAPQPRGFDLYGRPWTFNPPSTITHAGNRVIYGETPVLLLTGESLAKSYGVAVAPGYQTRGLRAGDTLATALDGPPRVESDGAPAAAPAGDYATIVRARASDQGYRVEFAPGRLRVDPAVLVIRADDSRRAYGAADPAFTARYAGFVLGQGPDDLDGALAIASAARIDSDVGRYALTPSGQSSPNYAITYSPGTLTIDPAPLRVTPFAARTYGAAEADYDPRFAGFVLGQGPDVLGGTLTYRTPATQASDAGRYPLTASGLTSGNYAITYAPGALDVARAPLRVTPFGSRTYGAAEADYDPRFAGFVLGQGPDVLGGALTYRTPATQASDAGRYPLTASGLTSGNYAITYAPGALDVARAPLRVTPFGSRTYGAAEADYDPRFAGFVLGQGPDVLGGALTYRTPATQASDAGRYPLTASGLTSGNYAITYAPGALDVARAPLSVIANDARRAAGAPDPAFSARYEGFALGQDADALDGALAFDTPATPSSPPGVYALTPGGLTSGNYAIVFVDGALTVTAAPAPGPGPGPGPAPGPGGVVSVTGGAFLERFGRGAPPLTPGDASFRTTQAEAPPAIDAPFALTYSLGEIVQLAPAGPQAADAGFAPASGGFTPASGGADTAEGAPAGTCNGPVNRGADAGCERRAARESFWTTTAEGRP